VIITEEQINLIFIQTHYWKT